MTIPINVENLINNHVIESDRIEYKRGWNPEKIAHTLCAFANDYENNCGGYIIVGIEEMDSRPASIVGLSEKEITEATESLAYISNLIEPRYSPKYSVENVNGKDIMVIWALAGIDRPYKCPISLGKDRVNNEKGYFIRHGSNTVRAKREEEIELIRISKQVQFMDSINHDAEISDIRFPLLENYLERVDSKLLQNKDVRKIDLLTAMDLVRGPPEDLRPVNVALAMFTSSPEKYFPYAWIDVVLMPDPTGEGMIEKSFKGPLDSQIIDSLSYLKANVVSERIFKLADRAEAERVFSYPYEAIEEILVNAVYHKDYRIPEQITVTVFPDCIEFKSFPGLNPDIKDSDLKQLRIRSSSYRNKRLGDFLKELHLTEGRNTGLPNIISALRRNGSPMAEYETDEDRSWLRVTLRINDRFRDLIPSTSNPVTEKRARRTREETKNEILEVLAKQGCRSGRELCTALGYPSVTDSFRRALKELLDEERVTYLYPDKPHDKRQRICINPAARKNRR